MRFLVLSLAFSLAFCSQTGWAIGVGVGQSELDRGDVDSDGYLTSADSLKIAYLLGYGTTDLNCLDAADVNDDGVIDITDVIYLETYLYRGGPMPCPPFPYCGPDQTEDNLGCEESNCF